LTLIALDDASFAALNGGDSLAGFAVIDGNVAPPSVLQMLRDLAAAIRPAFSPCAWAMMEEGVVLGLLSVVKPPAGDGAIEIGYGVAQACRGRGVCRRAVADLMRWAQEDGRVRLIRAETGIDNPASQRVLAVNGFTITGERTDAEDGELLVWERPV
jgi:RimJ/RimL family protein N-acetyltransferase